MLSANLATSVILNCWRQIFAPAELEQDIAEGRSHVGIKFTMNEEVKKCALVQSFDCGCMTHLAAWLVVARAARP